MKKIISKGFVMLLCGAALTACSHNDASYEEGYVAKSKAAERDAEYKAAFIKAFGGIAPGHQWGFDETKVAATRAGQARVDAFSDMATPNDLTSFKEGDAKKIRKAFEDNKGTSSLTFSFTNYWMQHVCEPDDKNSIGKVEAYDSSTGNWVEVMNFVGGKNNVENKYTNTKLKGTTLMVGMGGSAYNNPDDAEDPANGKFFRHMVEGKWCYEYEFYTKDGMTFLGLRHSYKQGNKDKVTYWCIRILAASYKQDSVVEEGRVFCEDKGNIGDFDFNDVVFDAQIFQSGKVTITLLAAGGRYPIKVAGRDVHKLMGQMVNTDDAGNQHAPVAIELSASEASSLGITSVLSIPVVVTYDEGDQELTAFAGEAPAKVCTYRGVNWADEYIDINKAYPGFSDWAKNKTVPTTWTDVEVVQYTDLDLTNN